MQIICLSSVDWEPLWTRKQQIMSRLIPEDQVLYIEAPITVLSAFKDPRLRFKWTLWLKGLRQQAEKLQLYSPPPILPFGNMYPWINSLNQRWLAFWVKKMVKKAGFKPGEAVVWTYLPTSLKLAQKLKPHKLIYDCVDEHSEYQGLINKEAMLSMERELLQNCDLVFVTAPGLWESKSPFASNIHLLPNAADLELFGQTLKPETVLAPELAALPQPILGFVGVIHNWIDLDVLTYLAQKKPEWSLVLVGPVGAGVDVSRLAELPNVHFVGSQPKEKLPSYLKGFAVCLNPFRQNELTRQVSPLKFYEYLASGRPIVSSQMPGVQEFAEIIEIAENQADFLSAVERALAAESPAAQQKRLEAAAQNSWESRVEFMRSRVQEILKSS